MHCAKDILITLKDLRVKNYQFSNFGVLVAREALISHVKFMVLELYKKQNYLF